MNVSVHTFLPPLLQAHSKVIKRGSIGIERATVWPTYTEVQRREVQNLPELRFTSAEFLLCSFTLSDVDHSAHKFNEMAGRAHNRMSYDVDVSNPAIRVHDTVVRLKLCFIADRRLG